MSKKDGYPYAETLVLGCGNLLFGDDGFGPAVAEEIVRRYPIPDNAAVINLGLSSRDFLFDVLLSDDRPRRIVVVDALRCEGKGTGEIFEVPLETLAAGAGNDFSFHRGPTSSLLKEIRDLCGVEVVILACQPESIPDVISPGLSSPVREAVPRASQWIFERYLQPKGSGRAHPAGGCYA